MEVDRDRHVLIIAASLSAGSRSYHLARQTFETLVSRNVSVRLIDLRETPLPLCTGSDSDITPTVEALRALVGEATHILFAIPVYNWDVNAAAKNLVEWMSGDELVNKTVGFLCAAGGQSSYMSVLPFANSLMLDFRCWIVPRFVYAVKNDFDANGIANPDVVLRIERLCDEMFRTS